MQERALILMPDLPGYTYEVFKLENVFYRFHIKKDEIMYFALDAGLDFSVWCIYFHSNKFNKDLRFLKSWLNILNFSLRTNVYDKKGELYYVTKSNFR